MDDKAMVEAGYDVCADAYAATRCRQPCAELAMLTERLSVGARLLDIGCGCGVPVTAALSEWGAVTGVDVSASQVRLARENVPSATFIHGDIMAQAFPEGSFDGVVAFYSLIHVPRAEQPELLARIARWLRPGGYLLATLSNSDCLAHTDSDFFGATMYWSHYQKEWYVERLVEVGFEIVHLGVTGSGFLEAADLPPEQHPIVLARWGGAAD